MNRQNSSPHVPWYHRGLWAGLISGPIWAVLSYLGGLVGPALFTESVDPRAYAAVTGLILIVLAFIIGPIRRWWLAFFRRLLSVRITTSGRIAMRVQNALSERPTHDEVKAAFKRGQSLGRVSMRSEINELQDTIDERDGALAKAKQRIADQDIRLADARRNVRRAESGTANAAQLISSLREERDQMRHRALAGERAAKNSEESITKLRGEVQRAHNEGLSEGRELGRQVAAARAAKETRLPRPAPRWSVERVGPTHWALRNLVPRSIAREVRIESDSDLTIVDAGHWPDLSPAGKPAAEGLFQGHVTSSGLTFGVKFTITWYDEAGKAHQGSTYMKGSDEAVQLA